MQPQRRSMRVSVSVFEHYKHTDSRTAARAERRKSAARAERSNWPRGYVPKHYLFLRPFRVGCSEIGCGLQADAVYIDVRESDDGENGSVRSACATHGFRFSCTEYRIPLIEGYESVPLHAHATLARLTRMPWWPSIASWMDENAQPRQCRCTRPDEGRQRDGSRGCHLVDARRIVTGEETIPVHIISR